MTAERMIEMVASKCNVSEKIAIEYLIAEEWDIENAIISCNGDRRYLEGK